MNIAFSRFAAVLLVAGLLAGCEEVQDKTPARTLTLPDSAQQVAEGSGQLKYHVPDDGRVFVYDVEAQTVVDVKHVRAGQRFVLSPDANGATLDGRAVMEHDLKRNHSYRLYFEKE